MIDVTNLSPWLWIAAPIAIVFAYTIFGISGFGSTIIAVDASDASGQKTKMALCPLTPNPNDDPANRLFALSGGFSAQGSVTESFRNPDGHGWTVTQSSGNTDSLHVFVYCS